MNATDTTVLEREVSIEASPETVYQYLVDPDAMKRWMGIEVELDPQPGGIFRVNVNGHNVARGEYVELVPHERVVFTWGWEGDEIALEPGASTVEFTLTGHGSSTLLRLVHRGLDGASAERHGHGWDHYLERLVIAPTGDPGPDPWIEGMS